MENMGTDRRRSDRLPGHLEAILITQHGLHPIHDISTDGLCFECGYDDFFPSQLPVSIVYAGTTLYIRGIIVRLVREQLEETDSFIQIPAKKVAVEFLKLDAADREQLDSLLGYHLSAGSRVSQ